MINAGLLVLGIILFWLFCCGLVDEIFREHEKVDRMRVTMKDDRIKITVSKEDE